MKNKLLFIAFTVILVIISAVPVLAGNHHGGNHAAKDAVCSVKSCVKTKSHTHNGKTYAAHYYNDGHKYHDYCDIEDCTLAGYHSHDGVYCFGHAIGDGHDYHNNCNKNGHK
jgi:hypothetical protein